MTDLSTYRTFLTHVAAVGEVGPGLVQVTFQGGDLEGFEPVGPDTFLYLLLPPPGRRDLTIDRSFTWTAYQEMPEELRPVGAYYTLRHWRPEAAELDIWMVLHDDPGPASGWATRAAPGDPVALWGPRTAYDPPPDTDWFLLVADETGLPAAAVICETLPPDVPIRVVAEVADAAHHQPLPERPGLDVRWMHRDGRPAGRTTALLDAVAAADWPEGNPYVWGGAESRAVSAVRRFVRGTRDLPRERVSLVGYWRHADHPPEPDED
ncbi:siderophore-interacting protein [Actinomarinicola tropica]|uniref:Siderophore-interacting protein n=1 Tax=Actinomarinicola tropica TaxID=2789776 RepID=A0A5Q2RH93_9ACTN|nr:siderophore-interacting protein [Actinomarinicola tropica]QGG93686.1 siderophore-interacting protein [Actinomarinicola tropica]